jgi:hypothetical protein
MLLSDADDLDTAVEEAGRGLVRVAKYLADTPGAFDAEVDVALHVYADAMASVLLPPNVLEVAASSGLAIRVSAYPCSDDDDGEPAAS